MIRKLLMLFGGWLVMLGTVVAATPWLLPAMMVTRPLGWLRDLLIGLTIMLFGAVGVTKAMLAASTPTQEGGQ